VIDGRERMEVDDESRVVGAYSVRDKEAPRGGNVRKRVNEKGRCNLRFAKRTSGAINA